MATLASGHSPGDFYVIRQLEDGYEIRTGHELLGHTDLRTTRIDTHMFHRRPAGTRSPLDTMGPHAKDGRSADPQKNLDEMVTQSEPIETTAVLA